MAKGLPRNSEDGVPVVDISVDIARFAEMGVLGRLLKDRSTGRNIIWASNVFVDKGESYAPSDEILLGDITGDNAGLIRTRASKAKEAQTALTRAHAEVFTPTWIVKKMVDAADDAWWDAHPDATWQDYVRSPRLEITCGEAPYLTSRYDAADGTPIPVDERVGILDRKLRLIGENTANQRKWAMWALIALKSTYGYEYQGDNLLIARANILATVEEFAASAGYELKAWSYRQIVNVISWNLWQMDGLSDLVPDTDAPAIEPMSEMDVIPGMEDFLAETLMDDSDEHVGETEELRIPGLYALPIDEEDMAPHARTYDWKNGYEVAFCDLKGEGAPMKFDYVIGNPPYQEETDGNGRQQPIYNRFMDSAYCVSDIVELITPARFLFNAGQTTKAWNQKMLEDEHLKVILYETDASKVFGNTDIKGGVAITLRDASRKIGPIGVFTPYPELNQIIHRVDDVQGDGMRLDQIFASQRLYKFSEAFFEDFHDDPHAQFFLGTGTRNKILSSAMEKMPEVFIERDTPQDDEVRFLGRIAGRRQWRCIKRRYLKDNEYLDAFKFLVPEANNAGKYGETLAEPLIGNPGEGTADTFLNAGPFKTSIEPANLARYYKTKFFRALLGARKVTQHCPAPVWHSIPLQDFTGTSDIDWSQSVAAIDRQLYAKYGLSQDEIDFIESHVKEMS